MGAEGCSWSLRKRSELTAAGTARVIAELASAHIIIGVPAVQMAPSARE